MSKQKVVAMGWFLGIVLVLAVCGCGGPQSGSPMSEQSAADHAAPDADTSPPDTTMTIAGEGATVTLSEADEVTRLRSGEGAKIPESFPDDVPLYPDMAIRMVMATGDGEYSISAASMDSIPAITDFFKKNCVEQGWTELAAVMQAEEISVLSYEKDGRTLAIMMAPEDDQIVINLTTITYADHGGEAVETTSFSGDGATLELTEGDETMTIRSGDDAELPESFPDDVPLYPGMALRMVMETGAGECNIAATSTDALPTIAEFFKEACQQQGWTEITVMTQGEEMSMLNYEKEGRALVIMMAREGAEVSISIAIAHN